MRIFADDAHTDTETGELKHVTGLVRACTSGTLAGRGLIRAARVWRFEEHGDESHFVCSCVSVQMSMKASRESLLDIACRGCIVGGCAGDGLI